MNLFNQHINKLLILWIQWCQHLKIFQGVFKGKIVDA